MKFLAILAAVFISAPAFVAADTTVTANCSAGGTYCAQPLLNLGYRDRIIEVLKANDQPTDRVHIIGSIFSCIPNGEIIFREFCSEGCGGLRNEGHNFCL